jgi:hypothetical protein
MIHVTSEVFKFDAVVLYFDFQLVSVKALALYHACKAILNL